MIRTARATDAAAIAEIWNLFIRDTAITFNPVEKTANEIALMIADRDAAGHGTWVTLEDGTPVGFASYAQFRGGAGYARTMEHTILLRTEAKGLGLGRALMETLIDHATEAGAGSLWAAISSANPEGRAFHRHMGFADIATLPRVGWKSGQWFDLHLMVKRLDPA